jgi:uncharacterized protein (TIGR02594 family)
MKKLIFLLAACLLVSFSFVTESEARPKHKKYHYTVTKVQKKKVKVVKRVVHPVKHQQPVQQPTYHDDGSAAAFFAADRERYSANYNVVAAATRASFQSITRSSEDLIGKASRYIGANARQLGLPSRLWCADFMNMLVGGNDRRAFSYLHRGRPAPHGCVNCVAVTGRRGGGHVGIVKGYDNRGNPIIISGNHNRRVGVGVYARAKVIAYRYI